MLESVWNIPAAPMQLKYNNSKSKSEIKNHDDSMSLAMLSTPRSHPANFRPPPRLVHRSQALTERERRLAFNLTSTCISGDRTPRFGIKRSKTLLEKPEQVYKPRKWYSEPSTVDFIRHLRNWNKETEEKLKETMHVLNMQRSKSDLDVRPPESHVIGGPFHGAEMLRERDSIFFGQVPEAYRRESIPGGMKQEVKISKAVVPKKGLISLSTDDQGFGINVVGEKQGLPSHESPHLGSGKKQHLLIRRKDIMDQIKMGNKLLEEYEQRQKEEEEMTKTLGEYTMLDLQSHILGMTDARSLKREKSQTLNSPVPPNKTGPQRAEKDKKPVTLPRISNINPF